MRGPASAEPRECRHERHRECQRERHALPEPSRVGSGSRIAGSGRDSGGHGGSAGWGAPAVPQTTRGNKAAPETQTGACTCETVTRRRPPRLRPRPPGRVVAGGSAPTTLAVAGRPGCGVSVGRGSRSHDSPTDTDEASWIRHAESVEGSRRQPRTHRPRQSGVADEPRQLAAVTRHAGRPFGYSQLRLCVQ